MPFLFRRGENVNKDEEQYKMFVDSAEKNSEKRIKQNNIYLTFSLALVSFLSATNIEHIYFYIISIFGIILSLIWLLTIDNHAKRNQVKFSIINEFENKYELKWFSEEEKRIAVLPNLTFFEKTLPLLFIVIYIVLIVTK